MANAADYLVITQNSQVATQLATSYKLRTRSENAITFVATNAAPNYTLSVLADTNTDGVDITPATFTLSPNESITVTVNFDTAVLETLPAGTLSGLVNFTVNAVPIVIPAIPEPPPPPQIAEVPRQITSRIEIVPNKFVFSSVNESKQLQAILYVDDTPVTNDVAFSWRMTENLGDGFKVSQDGVVTALRVGVFSGVVSAKLTEPKQYTGTVGLARVASNVPKIITVNEEAPVIQIPGRVNIKVSGLPNNVNGNITVTGQDTPITGTTTLSNLLPGNYTVTPNVVSVNGENYIPTGGGAVNLQDGETANISITYGLERSVDDTSIQILEIRGPKGNVLQNERTRAFVGETITIIAQTYKGGVPTNLGPITFNASKTSLGTQTVPATNSPGRAEAVFNIVEEGLVSISATCSGKVASGKITAVNRGRYTIKFNAPQSIYAGQTTAITAMVFDGNTPLPNIPVQISVSGGILSDTPPAVIIEQPVSIPEPTATGTSAATGTLVGTNFTQPIVDRATTTSRTLNEAELRTGGNTVRDTVVFLDQGELAI